MWKEYGGDFNSKEQKHLLKTPIGSNNEQQSKIAMTKEQINKVKNGSHEEAISDAQTKLENSMSLIDADPVLNHPNIVNTLKEAVHPVNLATGTVASLLSAWLMNFIDKTGSYGMNNETGIVLNQSTAGALSGGMTYIASTGLAGSSLELTGASVGLFSGAAAAAAAEATRYSVKKALKKDGANSDTQESVSIVSAGAVGGVVAAGAADLGAIGFAAVTGAEIGSLGGPVGLAVGASIGVVLGAAAYGVSKLQQNKKVQAAESVVKNTIVNTATSEIKMINNTSRTVKGWFKKNF